MYTRRLSPCSPRLSPSHPSPPGQREGTKLRSEETGQRGHGGANAAPPPWQAQLPRSGPGEAREAARSPRGRPRALTPARRPCPATASPAQGRSDPRRGRRDSHGVEGVGRQGALLAQLRVQQQVVLAVVPPGPRRRGAALARGVRLRLAHAVPRPRCAAAPSGRAGSAAEAPALGAALGSRRQRRGPARSAPRQRGAPGSRSRRPPRRGRGAARSGGSKVCGASGGAAVPGRREGAGGGRAADSARLPWGSGAPCAPPPPAPSVAAARGTDPTALAGPPALPRAGAMSHRRDRASLPPLLPGHGPRRSAMNPAERSRGSSAGPAARPAVAPRGWGTELLLGFTVAW